MEGIFVYPESFEKPADPARGPGIFTGRYWREAARQTRDVRVLVFAALILALRVAVKVLKIQLAPGLSLTFDCYVNSLGSMVYGPVVALMVGAASDTLGCILFPGSPYFFPFIFVEMASGFIFALFLWRRRISPGRVLLSKFTVNLICNIIMTSVIMKWDYYFFYGIEKAEAYNVINLVRIAKNLVLFPLEATLIVLVLGAAAGPLSALGIKGIRFRVEKLTWRSMLVVAGLALLSVGIVLLYVFWLKDYVSAHNIKWL